MNKGIAYRGGLLVLFTTMLLIYIMLFTRIGYYVDEYGTSPDVVWGSEFLLIKIKNNLFK